MYSGDGLKPATMQPAAFDFNTAWNLPPANQVTSNQWRLCPGRPDSWRPSALVHRPIDGDPDTRVQATVSSLINGKVCPLCQKPLDVSRYLCLLPCGHEFCAACVRGMASRPGALTCICFREHEMPLPPIRDPHAQVEGYNQPDPGQSFVDSLLGNQHQPTGADNQRKRQRPIEVIPPIPRQDIIKRHRTAAPSTGPLFYFDFSLDDVPMGTVLIRTFKCTPMMSLNFKFLVEGGPENGYLGYRGCAVLQAWPHQSLILGDVEYNNGYGGRAALGGGRFQPDHLPIHRERGLVGMRRHVEDGLVASQFRIVLSDPRTAFTGWFGRVEWGLDFLDRISETGNEEGNPTRRIIVSDCGQLE